MPNNEKLFLELGQDICTLTITRAILDDQAHYTVRVNETDIDHAQICVNVTDEGLSRERYRNQICIVLHLFLVLYIDTYMDNFLV